MLSGEESAAGEVIQGGAGVPTWNEDPLLLAAVFLPPDCDPVGGILTRETEKLGNESRTDRLQSDQTDPGDGMTSMDLRAQARRKLRLDDTSVNPEVHEDAPPNHALDDREAPA
jgi:hypothetical protein